MKIGKRTVDRTLTILAAASAPLLSILTRHHVITAADATDYGTVVLAVVAAYHGGAYVQRDRAVRPIPPNSMSRLINTPATSEQDTPHV